jgi:hypothetical protein
MKMAFKTLTAMLVLATTARIAVASVTFSDGTFNNADWQVPIMYQGYNGGTLNAYQVASGGNPGSYQEVDTTLNGVGGNTPWSNIVAFHQQLNSTYDSSVQGAISSIDFSLDVENHIYVGLAIGAAIEQNGMLYAPLPLGTNGPTTWTNYTETGLTASSFWHVINSPPTFAFVPGQPDFSSTGAPISFGYYTFEATTDVPYTIDAGYDNWSVTVHSTPEPSTLVLGIAGLAGLSLFGLRKKVHRGLKALSADAVKSLHPPDGTSTDGVGRR